jgi:hypothetical protein
VNASSLSAIPEPADAVFPERRPGFLGIVMLDTRFPRPKGDVGHPETFGVPVRQRIVPGAFPRQVVASAAALRASGLHLRFIEALRQLEAEGARALTASCGFLVLLQQELQAGVRVPLVSSSLLQLPELLAQEPQVGVLTISAEHLTDEYLLAAGVPRHRLRDVLVQGVDPAGPFATAILGNRPELDLAAAEADVVGAARALQRRAPQLRTLVLECTNMPPYAKPLADATAWRLRTLLDAGPLLKWADA